MEIVNVNRIRLIQTPRIFVLIVGKLDIELTNIGKEIMIFVLNAESLDIVQNNVIVKI